jgi:hypothetical protein
VITLGNEISDKNRQMITLNKDTDNKNYGRLINLSWILVLTVILISSLRIVYINTIYDWSCFVTTVKIIDKGLLTY